MPVVKESELKDCEWVVGRYKSHLLKNDRSSAKAWILTARSLFPDNFDVQVLGLLVRINWKIRALSTKFSCSLSPFRCICSAMSSRKLLKS